MKPLQMIYWLRLGLGVTAALICIGYGLATNTIPATDFTVNTFINGISIALIVYLVSYYLIKSKFSSVVDKTQKLATAGIGIYLLSWIVFWTLLYTITANIS